MDYTAPVDLTDRVAIVTGASRGIGLAIADAFTQAGANVVITARKQHELDEALTSLPESQAISCAGSADNPDAVVECVDTAMREFGRVDIVVNNAATNPAFGPLIDVDLAAWRKTFAVNLDGPLLFAQAAWRAWMQEHGGSILNVTTSGMYGVAPLLGGYEATKTALRFITKQLAGELAPTVRVNSLSPGTIRTQMARVLWENGEEAVSAGTPLGRIGLPEDCAQAALFLCSDKANWVTGMDFLVDGGVLVRGASLSGGGEGNQILQNLHDAADSDPSSRANAR